MHSKIVCRIIVTCEGENHLDSRREGAGMSSLRLKFPFALTLKCAKVLFDRHHDNQHPHAAEHPLSACRSLDWLVLPSVSVKETLPLSLISEPSLVLLYF